MEFPTATPTSDTALSGNGSFSYLNFNKSAVSENLTIAFAYLTGLLSILYLQTAALVPLLLAQLWLFASTLFGYMRQMDLLFASVYPYVAVLVDLVYALARQLCAVLVAMPAVFPYIKAVVLCLLYPVRWAAGISASLLAVVFSPVLYVARCLGALVAQPVILLSWIMWRLKPMLLFLAGGIAIGVLSGIVVYGVSSLTFAIFGFDKDGDKQLEMSTGYNKRRPRPAGTSGAMPWVLPAWNPKMGTKRTVPKKAPLYAASQSRLLRSTRPLHVASGLAGPSQSSRRLLSPDPGRRVKPSSPSMRQNQCPPSPIPSRESASSSTSSFSSSELPWLQWRDEYGEQRPPGSFPSAHNSPVPTASQETAKDVQANTSRQRTSHRKTLNLTEPGAAEATRRTASTKKKSGRANRRRSEGAPGVVINVYRSHG